MRSGTRSTRLIIASWGGEEPSNFAMLCYNHMKLNNIKKVFELGAGHGRDSMFFASNEIEVEALDYSILLSALRY